MLTEIILAGKLLPVQIGDFVTARVINTEATRQGCISGTWQNLYLTIAGESGARYVVEPDVALVPDDKLFGTTRDFVRKFRRELGIASLRDLPDSEG
jgi:hypothetical protein